MVANVTSTFDHVDEQVEALATSVLAMALSSECKLPFPGDTEQFAANIFSTHAGTDGLLDATEFQAVYDSIGLAAGACLCVGWVMFATPVSLLPFSFLLLPGEPVLRFITFLTPCHCS